MKLPLSYRRDHYAGGLMALIGLGVALQAARYGLGTREMMGPGALPMILGLLLLLVGALIIINAEKEARPDNHAADVRDWRGWICIVAGVLSFVLFAERFGLLLATFSCVFISALGDRGARLKQILVLAVCVTLFGAGLFSYGLRIPLPLVNW